MIAVNTTVILLSALLAQANGASRATPTGPLDFRCDSMNFESKPNRVECIGNIVARRDTLLVCCERFEGDADDKWQWKSFKCINSVRAVRGGELMWSDQARFDLTSGDLLLTGRPRLRRGPNLLDGDEILIETETDKARVVRPRGRLDPDAGEPQEAFSIPKGKLPAKCPLPRRSAP
ncbi:MAG: hypothetical protein AAFY60_02790 [Myxococcota bacterium]